MSLAHQKGASVRQKVKVIEGTVESFSFDEETGKIGYLVKYTDESGEHSRIFEGDDLEANPNAAPAEPVAG